MHGHKNIPSANPLFLALLWAHPILHISRIRVKFAVATDTFWGAKQFAGPSSTTFILIFYYKGDRCRDGVGGIMIRLRTGRPTDLVLFPAQVRHVSLLLSVQTVWGAHTASSSLGTTGLFQGVKRPGRQPDHSDQFMSSLTLSDATPELPHMPW